MIFQCKIIFTKILKIFTFLAFFIQNVKFMYISLKYHEYTFKCIISIQVHDAT